VGANPVQVEVGDFDEAIDVVEDVAAESKCTTCCLAVCSDRNTPHTYEPAFRQRVIAF